jgi:hypothetical protein
MAERLGSAARHTGMRTRAAVVGLAAVGLLATTAGCGSTADPDAVGTAPTATNQACLGADARAKAVQVLRVDLDGDGATDPVSYVPRTPTCVPLVLANVGGREGAVPLDDDLPVVPAHSFAITIPGRVGQVAVLQQEHPRGGFRTLLLGWSGGAVSTFDVDGAPVFPFVATDAPSTPLSASCTTQGFEITEARAHTPIGVLAAWDVYRTPYTVNGNTVTRGASTEIADNVLDRDLAKTYSDLVHHRLFTNCRVAAR